MSRDSHARPTSWKNLKVLTAEQVEQFMELGFVHLRGGFSRASADAVRHRIWEELKLDQNDPTTWTQPFRHLQFTLKGEAAMACYTQRVLDAFDDVCGIGRWDKPDGLGWWPVSFPGHHHGPWEPPVNGWHIDGQHFHHKLRSHHQGLLPIFMFSDCGPGDGGTAIAPGSHYVTARVLRDAEPDGLSATDVVKKVHTAPWTRVIENNGEAGDVVLIHPFLSHSVSKNMSANNRVRFMCNVCLSLKEDMNLERPDGAYSPVEEAIRRALEMSPATP